MATFPSYVKLGWRDTAEKPAPLVVRSEMERGIARQRRMAADSLVTVPLTAYFDTAADSLAFESWFFGDAGAGAAWFDFTLPRTGTVTQARVVDGDIGQLKPTTKNWAFSERTFQLEYIRPGFVQLAPGLHTVDAARILSVQRNSTATYVDDAGVLQTAPANVARWQGGQVLVESEATNLCLQSQALNTAPWSGGAPATLAAEFWKDGPQFWTLTKASSIANENRTQSLGAVAAGEVLTVTVALLAGTVDQINLGLYSVAAPIWGVLSEATAEILEGPGTITYPHSLAFVDNLSTTVPTLVRITRTYSSATSAAVFFYPAGSGSVTVGQSIKVTRVDVERGSVWSSYIPTTTATATRAADLITVAA